MCDFVKNLMTSNTFSTIIAGVFVFVISQLFDEYWLKPIHSYKELRARISYNLTLYANLYMNPAEYEPENIREERNVASNELRKLAAEVDSMIELRPLGNFCIARKRVLSGVSRNLIGLSNNLYAPHTDVAIDQNENRCKEIYRLFKIRNK